MVVKSWHHCFTSMELLQGRVWRYWNLSEMKRQPPWETLKCPRKVFQSHPEARLARWKLSRCMLGLWGQTCDALKWQERWALAATVKGNDKKWGDCTMVRKEKWSKVTLKQKFKQCGSDRWLDKSTGTWDSSIQKNQESMWGLESMVQSPLFLGEAWGKWESSGSWLLVVDGITIRRKMS